MFSYSLCYLHFTFLHDTLNRTETMNEHNNNNNNDVYVTMKASVFNTVQYFTGIFQIRKHQIIPKTSETELQRQDVCNISTSF